MIHITRYNDVKGNDVTVMFNPVDELFYRKVEGEEATIMSKYSNFMPPFVPHPSQMRTIHAARIATHAMRWQANKDNANNNRV